MYAIHFFKCLDRPILCLIDVQFDWTWHYNYVTNSDMLFSSKNLSGPIRRRYCHMRFTAYYIIYFITVSLIPSIREYRICIFKDWNCNKNVCVKLFYVKLTGSFTSPLSWSLSKYFWNGKLTTHFLTGKFDKGKCLGETLVHSVHYSMK